MNFATKIAISAGVAGLFVGIYYADEWYTKKEEAEKTKQSLVFSMEPEKVVGISLRSSGGNFSFQRASATEDWKITEPQTTIRADQESLGALLGSLKNLKIDQDTGDLKEPKGYGLEKPRASVTLTLDDKTVQDLQVGEDISLGEKFGESVKPVSVYAWSNHAKHLWLIPSSITQTLNRSFENIRTKSIARFSSADVAKFSIQTKTSKVVVEKKDNQWHIVEPQNFPGDSNNIAVVLDRFSRGKSVKVIEQKDLTPAKLTELNMLKPQAKAVFWDKDGKELQTFQAGQTSAGVSITMADGAMGSLSATAWMDYFPEALYFRDKRVLLGLKTDDIEKIVTVSGREYEREGSDWYFVFKDPNVVKEEAKDSSQGKDNQGKDSKKDRAPDRDATDFFNTWEFLSADNVIDRPKPLSTYGLDKPIARFTFHLKDKKATETIVAGNRVPLNEKHIYVKRSSRPEVYSVDAKWMDTLSRMNGTEDTAKSSPPPPGAFAAPPKDLFSKDKK